jgi:enolase
MLINQIKKIKAKQILDSRKKPTIQVDLFVNNKVFSSQVPSGASTGKYEAKVLKTAKAIENVNKIINLKLIGKDPSKQKQIDDLLIKLDGTKNKSKLGANALCGVSMAVCRAGAGAKKISLYQHVNDLYQETNKKKCFIGLPRPAFNIINGGAHAKGGLDIQEFMVIPQENCFSKNLKTGEQIYQKLKQILFKKYGKESIKIGDEGGFVPCFKETEQAINLIIKSAGKKKIKIALDSAASQFFKKNRYFLEGKKMDRKEMILFYEKIIKQYPLTSIEDPFEEEDFNSWVKITRKFGKKITIIGDDLLVTNPKLIKKAEKKKACNGMILKINQIGTVTEALQAAFLARSFNWKIMVSHRSGETYDDFIADLAVAIKADFIKSGAPFPKERMTKYNRLVKIEKEILK